MLTDSENSSFFCSLSGFLGSYANKRSFKSRIRNFAMMTDPQSIIESNCVEEYRSIKGHEKENDFYYDENQALKELKKFNEQKQKFLFDVDVNSVIDYFIENKIFQHKNENNEIFKILQNPSIYCAVKKKLKSYKNIKFNLNANRSPSNKSKINLQEPVSDSYRNYLNMSDREKYLLASVLTGQLSPRGHSSNYVRSELPISEKLGVKRKFPNRLIQSNPFDATEESDISSSNIYKNKDFEIEKYTPPKNSRAYKLNTMLSHTCESLNNDKKQREILSPRSTSFQKINSSPIKEKRHFSSTRLPTTPQREPIKNDNSLKKSKADMQKSQNNNSRSPRNTTVYNNQLPRRINSNLLENSKDNSYQNYDEYEEDEETLYHNEEEEYNYYDYENEGKSYDDYYSANQKNNEYYDANNNEYYSSEPELFFSASSSPMPKKIHSVKPQDKNKIVINENLESSSMFDSNIEVEKDFLTRLDDDRDFSNSYNEETSTNSSYVIQNNYAMDQWLIKGKTLRRSRNSSPKNQNVDNQSNKKSKRRKHSMDSYKNERKGNLPRRIRSSSVARNLQQKRTLNSSSPANDENNVTQNNISISDSIGEIEDNFNTAFDSPNVQKPTRMKKLKNNNQNSTSKKKRKKSIPRRHKKGNSNTKIESVIDIANTNSNNPSPPKKRSRSVSSSKSNKSGKIPSASFDSSNHKSYSYEDYDEKRDYDNNYSSDDHKKKDNFLIGTPQFSKPRGKSMKIFKDNNKDNNGFISENENTKNDIKRRQRSYSTMNNLYSNQNIKRRRLNKKDFFLDSKFIPIIQIQSSEPKLYIWYKDLDNIDDNQIEPFLASYTFEELHNSSTQTFVLTSNPQSSNEKVSQNNENFINMIIIKKQDACQIKILSSNQSKNTHFNKTNINKIDNGLDGKCSLNEKHLYAKYFSDKLLPITKSFIPEIMDIQQKVNLRISNSNRSSKKIQDHFIKERLKSYIVPNLLPISNKRINKQPIFADFLYRVRKGENQMGYLRANKILAVGNTRFNLNQHYTIIEGSKSSQFQTKDKNEKLNQDPKTLDKTLYFIKDGKLLTSMIATSEDMAHTWVTAIKELVNDKSRYLLDLYLANISTLAIDFDSMIYSSITSPFILFTINLLNLDHISISEIRLIFSILCTENKIVFFLRTILFAEMTRNKNYDQIFFQKEKYSVALFKLFSAISNDWLDEVSLNMMKNEIKNCEDLIEFIIFSFSRIATTSLFFLRALILTSLIVFDTNNIAHPLIPFFNFILSCLRPFISAYGDYFPKFNNLQLQVHSLLISEEKMKSRSVLLLSQFMKKIINEHWIIEAQYFEIPKNSSLVLYKFMNHNIKDILLSLKKDQKCVKSHHPLFYSFYQNLKFLIQIYAN